MHETRELILAASLGSDEKREGCTHTVGNAGGEPYLSHKMVAQNFPLKGAVGNAGGEPYLKIVAQNFLIESSTVGKALGKTVPLQGTD